jgi:hypothetical protein
MAVADDGDIVDHVEIGAARGVDQVVAPTAFDAWRVLVVMLLDTSNHGVAPSEELVGGVGAHIEGRVADERGRIRRQRTPGRGHGRLDDCPCGHACGRQLHVNVCRQRIRLGRRLDDPTDDVSGRHRRSGGDRGPDPGQ